MRRRFLVPVVAVLAMGASASAQQAALYDDPADTRHALSEAKGQADAARTRAERLEADAARATQSADRTAAQAAAIAARVQQAEAEIAGDEARIHQIERQRAALRSRLSQKQRPLMRLTGAGLPAGASGRQFFGVCVLCGIGFTMSLFIGGLAFAGAPHAMDAVKIGVFAGSILSGVAGWLILRRTAQ